MDGKQLREIRKSRGLNQVKLAEQANISQSLLSMIERGAATPSLTTLRSIAAALGMTLNIEMIDGAGETSAYQATEPARLAG